MRPITDVVQINVTIWPITGETLDVSPWVRRVTFRTGREGGQRFVVGLKVGIDDAEANASLHLVRDYDWVRIAATNAGRTAHFLGSVRSVTVSETTDPQGNILWDWEISGVGWGDLVLETELREPLNVERLPGFLPYTGWLAKFLEAYADNLTSANLSDLLKRVLQEVLWHLYPYPNLQGKPLIDIVSWERWHNLRGVCPGMRDAALSLTFQVASLIATTISADLHDLFFDYTEDGTPAPVLREHPLLIWSTIPSETVPPERIREIILSRPGGPRVTAWFPGSLATHLYNSRVLLDYGSGIRLPIIETPLLARFGLHPHLIQDPSWPPLGLEKAPRDNFFGAVVKRTVRRRDVGVIEPETFMASLSLGPLFPVPLGVRLAFKMHKQTTFLLMTSEYQKGTYKPQRFATDALEGYVDSVTHSLRVTDAEGNVESRTDIELLWVRPQGLKLTSYRAPQMAATVTPEKGIWVKKNAILVDGQMVPVDFPVQILAAASQSGIPHSSRDPKETIRGFVLHHSGTLGIDSLLATCVQRAVSTHFAVSATTIYQLFDPWRTVAYHARGYNKHSIGIDFLGGPPEVGTGAATGTRLTPDQVKVVISIILAIMRAKSIAFGPIIALPDEDKAKVVLPYRPHGVTTAQWRKSYGLVDPLNVDYGIFAHNQLDDNKWDPCQPSAEWEDLNLFWDMTVMPAVITALKEAFPEQGVS